MKDDQVVLYILMRTDLASMTPGRACAQSAHAANHAIKASRIEMKQSALLREMVKEWQSECFGFYGTTIVLGCEKADLEQLTENFVAQPNYPVMGGIVHDPEYAVKDGETTHLIPLDTCGWYFGRRKDIKPLIEHLYLF